MEQQPHHYGGEQQDRRIPASWRERRPEQRFFLGPWSFSIDKARDIICECPRETHRLPVKMWARAYGLTTPAHATAMAMLGPGPDFDREYAMTTDLHEPLIVATMHSPELADAFLLIDGTHRLYRAYVERVPDLPAFVLDADETQAIRDDRPAR